MRAFRDRLVRHRTIEAAYLDLVRRGVGAHAAAVHQSARARDPAQHARRLRGCLHAARGGAVLPAAAAHRASTGSLIAADEETVVGREPASRSRRSSRCSGCRRRATSTCSTTTMRDSYWERSDRFDMALDLTAGRRGLAALGEVIERWIAHLLSVDVDVEPLIEAADVNLTWYVGLDAEATAIGDALWNGAKSSITAARRAHRRPLPAHLPRRRNRAGQGQGRAHLSDNGDDARPDVAHEAAKPRDRACRSRHLEAVS